MSGEVSKIPEKTKTSSNKPQEHLPMTPEQKDTLLRFLQEKQSVLGDTTQKLHQKKPESQKTDYYELAAFLGKTEKTSQLTKEALNIDEKFISADGVLKNISGKTTINNIVKTPGKPAVMTLQVPKTIVEGRGVTKDVPHEIRWDEQKNSYVYSTGPAQGLRPFVKDGMILRRAGIIAPTAPLQTKTETVDKAHLEIDNLVDGMTSLSGPEKQFCKKLFGILTTKHADGLSVPADVTQKLGQETYAQLQSVTSNVLGYKNITDGDFVAVIEQLSRTVLAEKTIPEKIKIAFEDTIKTDKTFGNIRIDAIIHEKSEERFLTPDKISIAEAKNKKFIEGQPAIKSLIWDFLPKALGYSGEMSYKQVSLLIAQLQTKHGITPIDGCVTDIKKATGKILIQECSQAKVASVWNNGKIGDNNYLPHGVKFIAPLNNAEKEALTASLPAGKNLDDGINDLSYQCASFLTYMNGGISGNAWTMPEFIISEGGQEVANALRNCDWSKLPAKPTMEQIQAQIRTEVKSHPIDIAQIQVGDVITMMHPKSKFQERAFTEGLAKSTRVVSTHVGQVTELNGQLFVTHNIHGVIFTEPLATIIAGKGLEGDIATGVFRLNKGNDLSSQFTRQKDRLARKVQKNLGGTLAMIP